VAGGSGNVSLRLAEGERSDLLAITPSKRNLHQLKSEDIVVIDFEGNPVEGELFPSTESMMHIEVYKARPEIHSVVHTHSIYATALAVAGIPLPPILDELVTYTGGEIRVADYGFPSTEELARNVVAALRDRRAALLRNHGVICLGQNVEAAVALSELVERAAHIYVLSKLMGSPNTLSESIIEVEKNIYRMLNSQTH
jgi:L-fuculose-phosphate aldolase